MKGHHDEKGCSKSEAQEGNVGNHFLKCLYCGKQFEDDYFRLDCDENHQPSLLRTVYNNEGFKVDADMPGMFKFNNYLPVARTLDVKGAPVTYRSEGLGRHLGLKNLFIVFNGYWPEKGAWMETTTFKELEAPAVLGRVPEDHDGTIVVASAGNTGRAFANICSKNRIPLVLVIPEENLKEIWSMEPLNDCVVLIAASGGSDYTDAIHLAGKITELDGFFPEGGAKNVARRDGMATTVLDAARTMGRIPDHYFQAIGSGTGGIAAWESYLRLRDDGLPGNGTMKLHLSQNHPFIPMVEAWKSCVKVFPDLDEKKSKQEIRAIRAKVLSNRKPPYSIKGGVRDILEESSGDMYAVTNQEVLTAQQLFERYEGIDIHPAAGVALGSLIQAAREGAVGREDYIALNITGGGEARLKRESEIYQLEPLFRFTDAEIHSDDLLDRIQDILLAV
jgi:cysteate synthase